MAFQTAQASLAAVTSHTFTFNKPAGNYGKSAGLEISSGSGAASWFTADTDNGDGTMTGTIHFASSVTGTAEIQIWDKL